jgi:hypothetical protein
MNVKARGRKITVILNHKAFKSSLKKMTTSLMAAVKPNGITYTQPLDRPGKVSLSRLH